jgi:hypothetical protein
MLGPPKSRLLDPPIAVSLEELVLSFAPGRGSGMRTAAGLYRPQTTKQWCRRREQPVEIVWDTRF